MPNTTTHNGDSKDKISLEEAAKIMDAMERNGGNSACVLQTANPEQVISLPADEVAKINVTQLSVESTKNRNTTLPEKDGDSFKEVNAAQLSDKKPKIVVENGRKVDENTKSSENDR